MFSKTLFTWQHKLCMDSFNVQPVHHTVAGWWPLRSVTWSGCYSTSHLLFPPALVFGKGGLGSEEGKGVGSAGLSPNEAGKMLSETSSPPVPEKSRVRLVWRSGGELLQGSSFEPVERPGDCPRCHVNGRVPADHGRPVSPWSLGHTECKRPNLPAAPKWSRVQLEIFSLCSLPSRYP